MIVKNVKLIEIGVKVNYALGPVEKTRIFLDGQFIGEVEGDLDSTDVCDAVLRINKPSSDIKQNAAVDYVCEQYP